MSNNGLWAAIALSVVIGRGEASAQTPIPPSPNDFAMAATQSDQYEILAARVAAVEGRDPRIRTFAKEMIQQHIRLDEDLRRAATASGAPPLPHDMSRDQASLLSALQSLRGADFDRAYARQQELAHAQAEAVEESFATAGADANLRKVAQSALPVIRDHLKMARRLFVDVGGT